MEEQIKEENKPIIEKNKIIKNKEKEIEDEKEMKFDFSIILKKNEIIEKITHKLSNEIKNNEKSKKKKEKKNKKKIIEEVNEVVRELDERLTKIENDNIKNRNIEETKNKNFILKLDNLEKEKKILETKMENQILKNELLDNKINELEKNYKEIILEKNEIISKNNQIISEKNQKINEFEILIKNKNNLFPIIDKGKKKNLLKNNLYEKNLKNAIVKEDYTSIEILSEKINFEKNSILIKKHLYDTFQIKKYKIFLFLLKKNFYIPNEIFSINIVLKKIDFDFCEENCCIEIIKILLKKNYDINEIDKIGNTPLIIAILKKKTKIANFLISEKCNFEIKNIKNENALFLSCENGDFEIIKNLVKNKCRVNFEEKDLKIPLCVLISKKLFVNENLFEKILIFLIDNGVNFNNNYNKMNCLYFVIKKKNIKLINLLINYQIKINSSIINFLCGMGDYSIFSIFENLIKIPKENNYFEKAVFGNNLKIIEFISTNSPKIQTNLKTMKEFFKILKVSNPKKTQIILKNLIKKLKSDDFNNKLIHFAVKLNNNLPLLKQII